ncbi:MAG: 5-formyltetrahydrofolate cyclo-ligase [Lachnospiraceae bacterium]
METKKEIREKILSQRALLSKEEWEEKSARIFQRVVNHPLFLQAKELYCYVDFRKEVATRPIMEWSWKLGKQVAVPLVTGTDMEFHYITTWDDLKKGYQGIMEPITGKVAHAQEALLLMPGAVFDTDCNRIGYGGGFYDRYLEKNEEYRKMALAFTFQVREEEIPTSPYDMKPEVIITEDGCYEEEMFTGRWL